MQSTQLLYCTESWVLRMQVQAEPTTINHVHVEGRSWTFNLEDELHVTFTGTSIDLKPIVLIRVVFADGDTYTWHKVSLASQIPLNYLQIAPNATVPTKSSCGKSLQTVTPMHGTMKMAIDCTDMMRC